MNNNNQEQKKYNPYAEYLPENRIKNEIGITEKTNNRLSKISLIGFWLITICIIALTYQWLNGNILKTQKRIFNLNLSESINLDKIYHSDNATWVSNSENVVIQNNVITALKSGEAYLYAKENEKIVSDVKVNVLTGTEAISVDKHLISGKKGEKAKVNVNISEESQSNSEKELTPMERIISDIQSTYNKYIGGNKTIEKVTNDLWNTNIILPKENDNTTPNQIINNQGNDNNNNTSPSNNDNRIDVPDISSNDTVEDDINQSEEEMTDIGNEELSYNSSNESVVTVDDEGNIDLISPGTAEITVTDEDGNSDTTVITVEKDDIILYNSEYLLQENSEVSIEYSLSSTSHTAEDIKWKSNNESVATINNEGTIHAIASGTTEITVSVGDITKQIKVTVEKSITSPTNIELSREVVTLAVGDSVKVDAKTDINTEITWTTDNENIAIAKEGNIIGKSAGTTVISATTNNGLRKEIKVTVTEKEIPIESITIGNIKQTMKVGETQKLQFSITPQSATNKTIKVNYDTNYIKIDASYAITALKSGITTLELVSENDKKASIQITIEDVMPSELKINTQSLTLMAGDSDDLNITFTPVNTTNKEIIWKSSNTNIARITNGHIEALTQGTAIITGTSKVNNSLVVSCTVTVTPAKTYTIKFDGNGNSSGQMNIQRCNTTNMCKLLKNQYIKTGYKFLGWSTSAASTYQYSDEQSVKELTTEEAITLYAIWEKLPEQPMTTNVTFNCNGGTGGGVESYTTGKTNKFSKTCTRTGYTQLGWSRKQNDTKQEYSTNSGVSDNWIKSTTPNLTLYAIWEKLPEQTTTTTVTFNCNGGTGGGVESYTTGKTNRFSKTCTRNGYTQLGWSRKQNDTKQEYSTNSGVSDNWIKSTAPNLTLYAIWEKLPEQTTTTTVTFNCNGGTGGGVESYTTGKSNKFGKTCTRNGYTQLGWSKKQNDTKQEYSTNSGVSDDWIKSTTPNLTLYAIWGKKKYTTSVTFNCNGGKGGGKQSFTTGGNNKFKTSCKRSGYILLGWSKKQNSIEKEYSTDSGVSDNWIESTSPNITIYAVWEKEKAKKLTVTFNCNGGTGGGSQTFTAGESNKFSTTCSRKGYIQTGWNKKANGSSKNYGTKSGVTDNWINSNSPSITLYATWAKDFGDPIVAFLPTTPKNLGTSDESILLRSEDGSLALIDTSYQNWNGTLKKDHEEYTNYDGCQKVINYIHQYAGLKNTEVAQIEYLILSHSHGDHAGCLNTILNNKTVKIKNIIIKNESKASTPYISTTNYTKKNTDTKLITANNLAEDSVVTIGSAGTRQIKIHLFNLKDVYEKENCAEAQNISFISTNAVRTVKKDDETIKIMPIKTSKGYVYVEKANSQNLSYTPKITYGKSTEKRINYYAYIGDVNNTCDANANSIAVLAEFPVKNNDVRYAYIPSDLQNNGYPFTGKSTTIEGKKVTLTGHSNFYKYDTKTHTFITNKNGELVLDTTKLIDKPQEYKTALAIKKKYNIQKIAVYASTHHGYNNDPASVNLLNLNRKDMYVVNTKGGTQKGAYAIYNQRSYYYTLSNVIKAKNDEPTGPGLYYTGAYFKRENETGKLDFAITNNGTVKVTAVKPH